MFLMEDLNFRRMRRRVTTGNHHDRHSLETAELNSFNKFEDDQDVLEATSQRADLLESERHVTESDVEVVASRLGASWQLLGVRLNFSPETLHNLEVSCARGTTDLIDISARMLRIWSLLPNSTVGRLATVLWEMGRHDIAVQLMP